MNRVFLALLTLTCVLFATACDPGTPIEADRSLRDGTVSDFEIPPPPDAGPLEPDAAEAMPRLNSIFPNRAPVDGGVQIRIVGADFVDGMRVRLGRRGCLNIEVVSSNHINCTVPAADNPTIVNLTVDWPDDGGTEVMENAFTYFEPLRLIRVEPPRGPAAGGILMTIRGRGMVVGTEVLIGGTRAPIETLAEDGREVIVRCPSGPPGPADVVIRNLNGSATLPDAFTWYEDLIVEDINPRVSPLEGGMEGRLAGVGLSESSVVTFGAAEAEVLSSEFERRSLRVTIPPAATPGPVDVTVTNTNGQWVVENGFLYIDTEDGDFVVHGFSPNRLPSDGGESFLVGGNGFTAETEVEVDGRPVPCVLQSAQLLECTPGPHAPGAFNVTVRSGDQRHEALDGLYFYRRVEIYDVAPARGGVAGGTLIEIVGRGFDVDTTFDFEGEALEVVEVVDSEHVLARTPINRPGWVSLTARSPDHRAILPLAFEYFDPAAQFGGVWGEPIVNAVNITVMNMMTGELLPEATVVVHGLSEDRGRWTGITNALGQVVISDEALRLPVAVTASLEGFTTTTFERLTTENATLMLMPLEPPMGNGEMEPIEPVRIRGMLRGIDELEKPTNEGFVLVVFVETSHTEPGNRLGASPPLPNGLLVEDGPFEIVVQPGELALIATAGYVPAIMKAGYEEGQVPFWTFRDALRPTYMGIRRFISGQPGDVIEGQDIALDIPLNQTVEVTLGNPSGGVRGAPNAFAAHAILSLGADGYFDFRYEITGPQPTFEVEALPDLNLWPDPDVTMRWEGEAEQTDPGMLYRYAWSHSKVRDMSEGVRIGPFVGTTDILEPRHMGNMNPFRWVEWRTLAGIEGAMAPTEPADIHLARVANDRSILWMHWVPGAANRFQYPQLPFGQEDQDLPDGPLQLSLYSLLIDGPFQFDDFTFNDVNRLKSYSFSYVQFFR